LFGIGAPAALQTCQRAGQPWACGQEAKILLAQLVAGKPVRCETKDRDRYVRVVAACEAGGVDLAQSMVSAGLAIALSEFTDAYVAREARARSLQLGIWGMPPRRIIAGPFAAAALRAQPWSEPRPATPCTHRQHYACDCS
jgi:endonuclease YncB( thermonuclease family)